MFLSLLPNILLFVLISNCTFAQPPNPIGSDRKSYTPGSSPGRNFGNGCSAVTQRILTGQCTAIRNPTWGQARFPQFSYISSHSSRLPRTSGLRSPRVISNTVFSQGKQKLNARKLNQLLVFFGQFIDHNLVATPESSQEMPIEILPGDARLTRKFLPFKRSQRAPTNNGNGVRQINTLSSALDLVAVYGPGDQRNAELLETDKFGQITGFLKTSKGNLLPLNRNGFVNAPNTNSSFFLAGDHRANEHPVLTAIHTVFLREHNFLAKRIKRKLPGLPPLLVYSFARILNAAQFQKIVYEEFYPAIVGQQLPSYKGFNPSINPTVSDIFSGAAFRFGHTMVSNTMPRRSARGFLDSVQTKRVFFQQAIQFSTFELDNFIRGTANTRAEEVDVKVVDALRNGLFESVRDEKGFDLVALNIQRGRDHNLPTFNEIRRIFGLKPVVRFRDITRNLFVALQISMAYRGKINTVEAFPGLLAEDHAAGSSFGETMKAVWKAEFSRLRDGDQFFYLRKNKYPAELRKNFPLLITKIIQPKGVELKDIILRNTKIRVQELPSDIFRVK